MKTMKSSQALCLALMGTEANGRKFTPEELLAMTILHLDSGDKIDRPLHTIVDYYLQAEDEYYAQFDGIGAEERYCIVFSEEVISTAAKSIMWFNDSYGKYDKLIMQYFNENMCSKA